MPSGVTAEHLEFLKPLWAVYRRPIKDFATEYGFEYREGHRAWEVPCDVAIPTACQNELDGNDAKALLANGCKAVVEAANMPSTKEAVDAFVDAKVPLRPWQSSQRGRRSGFRHGDVPEQHALQLDQGRSPGTNCKA